MNQKMFVGTLIGISLGIIVTFLAYFIYLSCFQSSKWKQETILEVPVAVIDIPQGVEITEEMIQYQSIPRRFLPNNIYLSDEFLVGSVTHDRIPRSSMFFYTAIDVK